MKELMEIYNLIHERVGKQLESFQKVWENGTEPDIFLELVFCLLTPQSKARQAEKAVNILRKDGLVWKASAEELSDVLNIVRFKNHKAQYIVWNREKFCGSSGPEIKKILTGIDTVVNRREWLVGNIKGMGIKEASHFLRNIGFGKDVAILDRHILRNLVRFDVIGQEPKTLNFKNYLDIEKRMKEFSNRIGIPMDYLDFVLWYREAKDVFK
jgi:N-glycosylase/DNA lyase